MSGVTCGDRYRVEDNAGIVVVSGGACGDRYGEWRSMRRLLW